MLPLFQINLSILSEEHAKLWFKNGEKYEEKTYFMMSINIQLVTAMLILLFLLVIILIYLLFQERRQKETLQHMLLVRKEMDLVNRECVVAEGIYDNVLEADITNNRLVGDNCAYLTCLLGIPKSTSFSDCIETILTNMVNEEYHELYRESFALQNILQKFANGQHKFTFDFIEKADLVHEYWTRVTVCIYYSKASEAVKIISYVKNIQKEKQKEISMLRLVNTDYLTGIFNKRTAEQRIHALLTQSIDTSRSHAMLMIDIDRFKEVNDTVGHMGGDKALCIVAHLLETHFEQNDIVSRFGGDEFIVMIKDYEDIDYIIGKTRQLIVAVTSDQITKEIGMSLSLSVGVALYPEHGSDYVTLFEAADTALYHIKNDGRNGYCLYEREML